MGIETKPFDAAKYLVGDRVGQIDLITDAFATGHADYIGAALSTVARANRQHQLAALCESGNPRLDTVLKVVHALGLELTVKVPEPA